MMIDVEHTHSIHRRHDRARTLQLDIADDEQISGAALPLSRARDLVDPRQDTEDTRNLIVNQDARILPLRTKKMHQTERRSDGITVRTDVRGEDDGLRITYDFCRLIERNLHASSSLCPAAGRSS